MKTKITLRNVTYKQIEEAELASIKSQLLLVIIRPISSVSILHTLDSSNNTNYYLCNMDIYTQWLSKLQDVCENVNMRGEKSDNLKGFKEK